MDLKCVLSVITCVFCNGSAPRHAAGGAVTLEEEEGAEGGRKKKNSETITLRRKSGISSRVRQVVLVPAGVVSNFNKCVCVWDGVIY